MTFPNSNGENPYAIGEIPGLDVAYLQALRQYRPGLLGPCYVGNLLIPTLSVPEWSVWSWLEADAAPSQGAGSTDVVTIFTVPPDERAWLDGVVILRASGDNTIINLDITYPADYRSAAVPAIDLIYLATVNARIFWPDPAGQQTIDHGNPLGPILLEPGCTVRFDPNGAGVAATIWDYKIRLRRTKLIRALSPV